jgi:hypothetical protein
LSDDPGSRNNPRPGARRESLGENRYCAEEQVDSLLVDDGWLTELQLRGNNTIVNFIAEDVSRSLENVSEFAAVIGESVGQALVDSDSDGLGKSIEIKNTLRILRKAIGFDEEGGAGGKLVMIVPKVGVGHVDVLPSLLDEMVEIMERVSTNVVEAGVKSENLLPKFRESRGGHTTGVKARNTSP